MEDDATKQPTESYVGEFRRHWLPLLGCAIGLTTGASLGFFTLSLFSPPMLADTGWSKADLALIGSVPLLTLVMLPVVGRFVDRVGAQVGAALGFAAVSLSYISYASMTALWQFFTIQLALTVFGVLTSSLCLGRVVIDRFDRARGLALSIMMSSSPVAAAIATPFLGTVIARDGWRAGYLVLAAICAIGGIATVVMIGGHRDMTVAPRKVQRLTYAALADLARHPAFALLMGGMLLVNLPQQFASSQLKLIALDRGVPDTAATWMVSLYAGGVVVGRWLCGIALDRARTAIVALLALGIPTLGYVAFASPLLIVPILGGAVLLMGLAQGSEGDVGAFILSRRFDTAHFSLLYGFMNMMVAAGNGLGSLILTVTLRQDQGYMPFILACAGATLIGAILFALAARLPRLESGSLDTDISNTPRVGIGPPEPAAHSRS